MTVFEKQKKNKKESFLKCITLFGKHGVVSHVGKP